MLTKNDLLVLGLLLERPMHGYEIGQALKSDGVETWFDISSAAVYYSLNKLNRLGMITEAQARRNSGDRTIYYVTEHGREQFLSDVGHLLASNEPIRRDYDLGIFMLNRLSRDQATSHLGERIEFLRGWHRDLENHHAAAEGHPLQQAIIQHAMASAELDVEWLESLTQRLKEEPECDLASHQLMTLQGDLEEFHLPDVIKLIATGHHGGTLTVTRGNETRSVSFREGHPVCAASRTSSEVHTDPERIHGDIFELFNWQTGHYIFDQRGCPREGCVSLDLSAYALILEGARRLNAWRTIERVVPSSDALFDPRDSTEGREVPALTEEEERVLRSLDGFRDVTAVAQVADLTEFETSKVLYGLHAVDLIRPADPDRGRLRRVFREFAELMCRSAIPYRTTPEEATACENEVNERCKELPVRISDSRIVDNTDAGLSADELAQIYRTFLQTQHEVLSRRLGQEIADDLRQQVLRRINPDLRKTLERYALL